ncbi:hypothetical protein ACVI1J_009121 [Bradyrhizobium diazoefficiens]
MRSRIKWEAKLFSLLVLPPNDDREGPVSVRRDNLGMALHPREAAKAAQAPVSADERVRVLSAALEFKIAPRLDLS